MICPTCMELLHPYHASTPGREWTVCSYCPASYHLGYSYYSLAAINGDILLVVGVELCCVLSFDLGWAVHLIISAGVCWCAWPASGTPPPSTARCLAARSDAAGGTGLSPDIVSSRE